jgi:cytochrome c peroxidase
LNLVKLRILAMTTIWAAAAAWAQPGGGPPPVSLKIVPVPRALGVEKYVRDQAALVVLGKIFFWDVQVGSDGKTACASCHFHAGADHRLTNVLAGPEAGSNRTLTAQDFPFHQFSNPNDNNSPVLRSARYVAGSAGVAAGSFQAVQWGDPREIFEAASGALYRQVTGRNTPSVINAVYNFRNFWDGRARETFTGATPFGASDTRLNAWVESEGQLSAEAVSVRQASLASQAVGPALDTKEMSFAGRECVHLGRKMLSLPPLGRQKVALDDSVLADAASPSGRGLRPEYTYASLIEAAFQPNYWRSESRNINGDLQIEVNFPLFWGLALDAYQATLVANDSRLDRFAEGNFNALNDLERQGLAVFRSGNAQCSACHVGAELTSASVGAVGRQQNPNSAQDFGFFRIGVRPIEDDLGIGGTDGFGQPLLNVGRQGNARGAMKTPSLRNVELTGPYFHNGGKATLEEVVDFYARHGDFPGGVDGRVNRIQLNQQQRTALVAFLKALTDERVRYRRAPFDHPSLCIADGHAADGADKWRLQEAVGRGGALVPLQTFEELLRNGSPAGNEEEVKNYCQMD